MGTHMICRTAGGKTTALTEKVHACAHTRTHSGHRPWIDQNVEPAQRSSSSRNIRAAGEGDGDGDGDGRGESQSARAIGSRVASTQKKHEDVAPQYLALRAYTASALPK